MHVIDLLNNSDRNFLEGMINNEADIIKFPGKMNVRGIKPKNPTDGEVVSLKTSPKKQALTTKDLATISDQALDRAYSYGRSVPGPNFGWLANMNSAMFAKRAIDSGETDIDRIAAEVHKGWAAAAIGDYKNKLPIDPPTPEETKLRRLRLAQIDYNSLPEKEKEKDRVVARALLQAISSREPSGNDVNEGDVVPMPARPKTDPVVNVQPASVLPFSQFRDPGTRNLERWKQQVRDRHPEYGNKIRFVSKDNGKVISAEIPGLDRSFGVFDLATEKGQVLDETGVAGPENCWPGHRKVGTQPGTGKNAGKRVNKCEKIKEQGVAESQTAKAGIVQTEVYGTKAYHAKCMEPNCDWQSKRYDRINQAQAVAKKHSEQHFNKKDVAEGSSDTIYPNAEIIKSKNGKPVGEIYQDGNSWGAFHYRADRGYDLIDSREDAIEALKDLHQETGRSRPDYTIKGVAEGMEGRVVFSGTGANGSKYEIIQTGPTDFMIHANGRHIDTYSSLQRAMGVLKNEVPGLQQGVAEADKHSMLGKIQRHQELKKKVDTSFADIGQAQKAGDHSTASKAFRKHERYANLERPGTWTKVDEQGVAEGSVNDYFKRRKDEEDRIAGTKAPAKRTPKQTDYEKKRKDQGVAEGYEPGDKVTWYYSNHYPKVEGTVVGIKDGKYRIKSVSPLPGQEHTDPAIYAVPKNNIMSHTKQGVTEENISELKKSTVKSYADKKQAELDDVPPMPFKKPGMSKAEHEKAAKGMMGALARLSGKKPTSKDVAETGNAFMTGIENTPEYKAGFSTGKLPVPYPEGSQQYVNYYKGVMDKAGPKGVAEGSEDNPVANAIIKRILSQRPDLLKYGADLVGDAVDEVASSVGKVQEIGTSDVSNWVRQVENYVKRAAQGNSNNLNEVSDEMLINYLTKVHQDAMKNPADPSKRSPEKRNKSVSGFNRAFNKLDARPRKDVGNDNDQAQALAPRVSEVSDVKDPGTMDHRDYIKQADELHAKMMAASQRNDIAAYEKLKAERDELDARARKGLREEEKEGRPRIRKYSKMRPDGSKAIRYEVLDHRGIRIPGQGVEGFDDLKYAKEFYHRNYDKLQSPVEEQAQEAPTEEPIREVAGRYWCKNEKRWKNVE
jgi:hypothetical protein